MRIIGGAFVVILMALAVWVELRNRVAFNSVVEIDMSGAIEEGGSAGGIAEAGGNSRGGGASVRELVTAIDAARDDRHIGGLVLKIGDANGRPAALKEIGAHVLAFHKSGKPLICSLDEEDDDNRVNAIAVACDKRIGEGPDVDDDVEEFFNERLGEDNWSRIDMWEYLKKTRGGG